jgi:hypothetical protein
MTDMSQPPATRLRWQRFTLRTLLAIVAIAAVASWAYWIGWPWWRLHREQVRFELGAKQLIAGAIPKDVATSLPWLSSAVNTDVSQGVELPHSAVMTSYVWPNAVYCICFGYRDDIGDPLESPCDSVKVYRLPAVPWNYRPLINRSRLWGWGSDTSPPQGIGPTVEYLGDFFDFVSGERKDFPGFQYELIYSHPPATAKPP